MKTISKTKAQAIINVMSNQHNEILNNRSTNTATYSRMKLLLNVLRSVCFDIARTEPVTAEARAARLGQKPAVVAVTAKALENAQALESLLIQQGVVAIAKVGLTAEQVALLRQTGIVVITDLEQGADVTLTQEAVEELAEKIVETVRL